MILSKFGCKDGSLSANPSIVRVFSVNFVCKEELNLSSQGAVDLS